MNFRFTCDIWKSKHGLKSNYSNKLGREIENRPLEEQLTSLRAAARIALGLASSRGVLKAAIARAVQRLRLLKAAAGLAILRRMPTLCLSRSPKISHRCFRVGSEALRWAPKGASVARCCPRALCGHSHLL